MSKGFTWTYMYMPEGKKKLPIVYCVNNIIKSTSVLGTMVLLLTNEKATPKHDGVCSDCAWRGLTTTTLTPHRLV